MKIKQFTLPIIFGVATSVLTMVICAAFDVSDFATGLWCGTFGTIASNITTKELSK